MRQGISSQPQGEEPPIPPPGTPVTDEERARICAEREEESAHAEKVHYQAVLQVVYQRMSKERQAEIDRVYRRPEDAEAKDEAISKSRAELLSHDESEADSLSRFWELVRDNKDFPFSCETQAVLDSARASGKGPQCL
jgi:hypothetical protein